MTKILLISALTALNVLFLIPQTAKADEIDRRLQGRSERIKAEAASYGKTYLSNLNAARLKSYTNFVGQHGGLVEDGTCDVGVARCSGEGYCPYDSMQKVSFSSINPNADYRLDGCRLNLKDGLACAIESDTRRNQSAEEYFHVDCYTANGEHQPTDVMSTGKKAPREAVLHAGKGRCSYDCIGDNNKKYIYRTDYCPSWTFGETLPSGVELTCR